ncbi:Uncharacterized protein Fot_32458 [Forsythia ovata]|uniref:Uncharacterized protein n=1 Tax=Forsythia ovata TaxID=205694 RepID=A0ABD1T837_9LAMI
MAVALTLRESIHLKVNPDRMFSSAIVSNGLLLQVCKEVLPLPTPNKSRNEQIKEGTESTMNLADLKETKQAFAFVFVKIMDKCLDSWCVLLKIVGSWNLAEDELEAFEEFEADLAKEAARCAKCANSSGSLHYSNITINLLFSTKKSACLT